MAELDWIEGLICFCAREQIESDLIAGVEGVWASLRGDRAYPSRADIDPVRFKPWLPYLSIVELHDDPFRIRYRLVGTEVARFAGQDFSGLWLAETQWSARHQSVNLMLYERLYRSRQPTFGLSQVDWRDRPNHFFKWALFPLGDDNRLTHCLGVDDFTHIARPSGLLRESSPKDEPTI